MTLTLRARLFALLALGLCFVAFTGAIGLLAASSMASVAADYGDAKVPRLVALVLDENPAAEELSAALQAWQREGAEHGRSAANATQRLGSG